MKKKFIYFSLQAKEIIIKKRNFSLEKLSSKDK